MTQKSLLIILILVWAINANGQLKVIPTSTAPPSQQQMDSDRINHECRYLNKYSIAQRDSFYPFNVAKAIKLVSFEARADKNGMILTNGRLPMKRGKIVYPDLAEMKTLEQSQIESLSDILYNNFYKGNFFTSTFPGCYNPKNAILFLDEKGNLIAFIEICFECEGYRTSSKKVIVGDFCTQKFNLLKAFFQQANIEFGITKGLDE